MDRVWKWIAGTIVGLGLLLAIAITATVGWRPFFGPRARPLTARKFEATPKIAHAIDHKAIRIKWLDPSTRAPAAGSRLVLLRELAGRICVDIFEPLSDNLWCETNTLLVATIA